MHEREDERDSERLRKRAALTAESIAMTNALSEKNQYMDPNDVDVVPGLATSSETEFRLLLTVHKLEHSHWITPKHSQNNDADLRPRTPEIENLP